MQRWPRIRPADRHHATGARLYVDGGDLTAAPLSEVVDALGANHTPAGFHESLRADYPDRSGTAERQLAQWLAGRAPSLARLRALAPVRQFAYQMPVL